MSQSTEPNAITAEEITAGTIYILSGRERDLILKLTDDAQRAAQQAAANALEPFNRQTEGALRMIYCQQGLTGVWTLSDDKAQLVKRDG
jgi:hypothetical protein